MASPDPYIPSTSDYDDTYYYIGSPDPPSHISLINNKVMVIAIVILFCLILLISSLHIFSKWIWGSDNRLNSSRVQLFINQNQAHFEARHSGLTKDAIAQLPIFTYKTAAAAGASSNDLEGAGENPGALLECAVCLSEFQENEKGRLLPSCKHSFHIECIDMWFYSHSTCPLCRAEALPTITNSPLTDITNSTQEGEELVLQEAQDAIQGATSFTDERSRPLNAMAIPAGDNVANTLQIPTNTLFVGESIKSIPAQVGSSQSSEKLLQPSSSRSTRSVPHITIEIPTMQDINFISPACISLSSWSSRCASPHDQAAYPSCKPLKSPGLRESVKRMLSIQSSKEKRALPSSSQEGNMESPKACS